MMDRQILLAQFEQFLDVLQADPPSPDYLGQEPVAIAPFDPYQMVAEWIALRHEVKQQGKILLASQTTLQQAVESLQAEKEQLQQQLATRQPSDAAQPEQKNLWRDLLTVLDAMDQAAAHWQSQLDELAIAQPPQAIAQPFWKQWFQPAAQPANTTDTWREVLVSNQQGIELIRRSLLEVLKQRQVTPMDTLGKPFNPAIMYAIGRQESASGPENTVIQEVVRGYWWGDRVLREAQVIVAAKQG
ncbi:MAG: nucleotide exchange factor GrpE [Leptolyngbyaceae cyanobacterium bins.349]|nr:nucleotide exchange factor GrpE [Leptolyngbyaceae cyanobacterium bins.349]